PQGLFIPENRLLALRIGIIAVLVAAEFLQETNLILLVPSNEGETIKALSCFTSHGALEHPFNHRLILLMEILPDVPALYHSPGIPFFKPQLDFFAAVVFRPPAFNVDCIRRKK